MAAVKRGGKAGALAAYLRARRYALVFTALFLIGVAAGSAGALAQESSGEVLRAMVLEHLTRCASLPFLPLLARKLPTALGTLLFLYLSANCRCGAALLLTVPAVLGISSGAVVTVAVTQYGYAALRYAAVCVAFPRFLLFAVLLLACSVASRQARGMSSGAAPRMNPAAEFIIAAAVLLQAALEAWITSVFGAVV